MKHLSESGLINTCKASVLVNDQIFHVLGNI
jgi:hypothetical protein